jgi:hypothetical protein
MIISHTFRKELNASNLCQFFGKGGLCSGTKRGSNGHILGGLCSLSGPAIKRAREVHFILMIRLLFLVLCFACIFSLRSGAEETDLETEAETQYASMT